MAVFDYEEQDRKEREKYHNECYENLKKHIMSTDENRKHSEFYSAHYKLKDMEKKIKEQGEKIKEYEEFFNLMSKLMYRPSSSHNGIVGFSG